jgi:MarR family transcriptional regulator for hemolysin
MDAPACSIPLREFGNGSDPRYVMNDFDKFVDLLHFTAHLWRNALDRRLRPLGISRSNWRILAMLKLHGEMNQGQLAEALMVEGPTVVRFIDKLERDGHVERVMDPSDRRVRNIQLTPSGVEMTEPIQKAIDQFHVEVFAKVGEQGLAQASRYLNAVRTAVSEMD